SFPTDSELMPDEPEVLGLLALKLLVEARRPIRTTVDGDLVSLAEQDRGRCDRTLIAEGQAIVQRCLRRDRAGPYQIQAAINAVHSRKPGRPAASARSRHRGGAGVPRGDRPHRQRRRTLLPWGQ